MPSAAAETARRWLEEFRLQAPARTVAALPYGDLDVAAVLGGPLRSLYARAADLSAATMPGYGVAAPLPVVAPTSGYMPRAALRRLNAETPVLLDESALPDTRSTVLERDGRAPLLRTDEAAAAGGPDPTRRTTPSGSGSGCSPSRRCTPSPRSAASRWWSPCRPDGTPAATGPPSRFFAGLDQPWLQLVDLPSVLSAARSRPAGTARLVYPTSQRVAEVPVSNLCTTRSWTGSAASTPGC